MNWGASIFFQSIFPHYLVFVGPGSIFSSSKISPIACAGSKHCLFRFKIQYLMFYRLLINCYTGTKGGMRASFESFIPRELSAKVSPGPHVEAAFR